MVSDNYCLTKGPCDQNAQFANLVGSGACNPSVLALTQEFNGKCTTDTSSCPDGCSVQGYGRSLPPPCGLNTGGNCGTGCCWDSTLCFPVHEVCQSGENTVTIPKFGQAPTISPDTSIALCIWNYTVQNVISKILKFIASYYDWLYCQIGLYNYNRFVLSNSADPTYAKAYMGNINNQCGQGYPYAPQTFTEIDGTDLDGVGPVVNSVAGIGSCVYAPVGIPCKNTPGQIPTFTNTYGKGLANNPGNAFTPPARLSSQVFQWFGWAETTLDDLDIANCVCGNLCNFLQMLINVDNSSSVIRNFVLQSTLSGPGATAQPTQLGCGNLYDEGVLVDGVGNIVGILDLMSEVFTTLGITSGGADGEALLQKLCACLIKSAAGGANCNNPSSLELAFPGDIGERCWGSNTTVYVYDDGGDIQLDPCRNTTESINVVQYQELQYRMQFFAALTDLLQYVLFDRDCDFPEDDDCTSCAAPTAEDWLTYRCKKGTGDGNCVVCSGACAGFRRKDDFNPLTSIIAVRYWLALLGLDRSDVAGNKTYCQQVDTLYNEAVTAIYNAYKGTEGDINFIPDCGAPQFCCTTNLAANSCSYDCCGKTCKSTGNGCLLPVPALDTRKAGYTCGGCGSAPYTPALGNCFDVLCLGNTESGTSESVTFSTGVTNWGCYANPCVTIPYCCNTVSCANESGCSSSGCGY